MTPEMNKETLYDLLKVDPKATISEIVSAYHMAKSAFSKDSLATYSLFSPAEAQEVMSKLDEAYQTLSNIDRRSEYDRRLKLNTNEGSPPMGTGPIRESPSTIPNSEHITTPEPTEMINGSYLQQIRMSRGLTVEEASQITKVPIKFIGAIEREDLTHLPARVYVQGFIKNLATLYKLRPQETAQTYLQNLDNRTAPK